MVSKSTTNTNIAKIYFNRKIFTGVKLLLEAASKAKGLPRTGKVHAPTFFTWRLFPGTTRAKLTLVFWPIGPHELLNKDIDPAYYDISPHSCRFFLTRMSVTASKTNLMSLVSVPQVRWVYTVCCSSTHETRHIIIFNIAQSSSLIEHKLSNFTAILV